MHTVRGRTATLKVKFSDFAPITRSRSLARPVESRDELEAASLDLLRAEMPLRHNVRLLGVSISNLTGREEKTAELQIALPVSPSR